MEADQNGKNLGEGCREKIQQLAQSWRMSNRALSSQHHAAIVDSSIARQSTDGNHFMTIRNAFSGHETGIKLITSTSSQVR